MCLSLDFVFYKISVYFFWKYHFGLLSFWIQARPIVLNYINKTSGVILILLGLKLATEQKS